ncbi:MAG TPA: DUF808 domain-containing protein, partial [Telluria sp.]|nr:DUF808 domain-containing protein [Telluria sp.]
LLAVLGTVAMFMVGGSIVLHGVPALYHSLDRMAHAAGAPGLLMMAADALAGLVTGAVVLGVVHVVQRLLRRHSRAGGNR